MLLATLECKACGAVFTADLDRGNTHCPQCGSSNTVPTINTSGIKKVIKS